MAEQMYIVNIDQCIADKSLPAIVRQLFTDIRAKGYLTAGDFYRDMSQPDLDILRDYVEATAEESERTQEERDKAMEIVTLLALGLTVGEGLSVTEESVMDATRTVILYTSLEQLSRFNMCEVFRENWTMDIHSDAPVAGPLK